MSHHHCFMTLGSWEGNAGYVRLREFGNELAMRGVRVSYILDDVPFNRDADKVQLHPSAERHYLPNPNKLSQFWTRRKLLKKLRPDYVHFLDPSVKSYLALVGKCRQKFFSDWDEWPAKRVGVYSTPRLMMEKYFDYWCRRRGFIRPVASKYLQRGFAELGYDSVYIPYATYLQREPDGESPFTEPTLVYVGNLYVTYDHDLILEAAKILKARGESPRIAILGSGPDLERCQAFISDNGLDNVEMKGHTTGGLLWRHIRHARALMFPIRETILNLARCPSKTFAYAQARRPILAGKVGEVAEVLGDKAIYVPSEPEAWARAIHDMMQPGDRPDVDYQVEKHNWSERCDRLLAALAEAERRTAGGADAASQRNSA
jgi:glycosyltransferase involved in cell wall biosynthesis